MFAKLGRSGFLMLYARNNHVYGLVCRKVFSLSQKSSLLTHLLGCQNGLEVGTLPSKLSSLRLNPNPAINRHPSVSQAGRFINACAVPRMDVKRASRLPALVGGC